MYIEYIISLGISDCAVLSSITHCNIQLEIVDSLSSILFGSNSFNVEAPNKQLVPSNTDEQSNSVDILSIFILCNEKIQRRMFNRLSVKNLQRMVDCLLKSYAQARCCTNNAVKRTIFWKAAFKGRSKPNLQKLEAHSIHCVLNILFQLYTAGNNDSVAEEFRGQLETSVFSLPFRDFSISNIFRTAKLALDYYIQNSHSDTLRTYWLSVIQLILNRTSALSDRRFNTLSNEYQIALIQLVQSEEQPIIRNSLYQFVRRKVEQSSDGRQYPVASHQIHSLKSPVKPYSLRALHYTFSPTFLLKYKTDQGHYTTSYIFYDIHMHIAHCTIFSIITNKFSYLIRVCNAGEVIFLL